MSQDICQNCEHPFSSGDVFCGSCGSQRTTQPEAPDGPASEEFLRIQAAPLDPGPAVIQPVPQAGHTGNGQPTDLFSHDTRVPPDTGRQTNSTRYLCAAAYLAPWFANTVIGELIASHRAVAPSRGIDL